MRARDATTLPLLRAAIAAGKPVLAICRGFQELNVALGGSLHQHVHEIAGRLDHREPQDAASARHRICPGPCRRSLPQDGLLARLSGLREAMVNSLHHQGVDRLADGLAVEAMAPDGQIEAVSMPGAQGISSGRAMASGMGLCRQSLEPRHFCRLWRGALNRARLQHSKTFLTGFGFSPAGISMPHPLRLLGFAFTNADFLFEVDAQGVIRFAAGAANDLVKESGDALLGKPAGKLFKPSEGIKFATFTKALKAGDRAGPLQACAGHRRGSQSRHVPPAR